MKLKIWIIYDTIFGNCKLIAEKLGDLLEEFADVYVGKASKLHPSLILEEKPDIIVFGAPIHLRSLNSKIKRWIRKFNKLSKKVEFNSVKVFGFSTTSSDINIQGKWQGFLTKYYSNDQIFPIMLKVKIPDHGKLIEVYRNRDIIQFSASIIKYIQNEY